MKKIILILSVSTMLFLNLHSKSNWIGADKIGHLTGSATIATWQFGYLRHVCKEPKEKCLFLSIGSTAFLGFAKEYSDKYVKKSRWSWEDIVWDGIGISLGLIVINNIY